MFERINAPFGAKTKSVDLSKPLEPDTIECIRKAFLTHGALVFRDQNLADEHLVLFGAIFGPMEEHLIENSDGRIMSPVHCITNFDADGKPSYRPYINTNYFWHSDKSYMATPSLATMLYPVELPAAGGDTQLAHMGLAYARLPDVTRQKINRLRAVHSLEFMRQSLDNPPPTPEQLKNAPPVTHPLVRLHAETGQPCLYTGMYASHIEGLPVPEGRTILARLQEQSTQPPFLYTHKWRIGDVLIWDNRCLMHRGVANYSMGEEKRVMKRICVKDTPVTAIAEPAA